MYMLNFTTWKQQASSSAPAEPNARRCTGCHNPWHWLIPNNVPDGHHNPCHWLVEPVNRNVFRINYSGAYNNNTKLCNACTENTTTNIVSAFDSIVLHGRPAGQYALQLHCIALGKHACQQVVISKNPCSALAIGPASRT